MPVVKVKNVGENSVVINKADGTKGLLSIGETGSFDLTDGEIKSLKKTPGYEVAGTILDASGAPVELPGSGAPAKTGKASRTKEAAAPAPVALPGAETPAVPAALPLPGAN